MTLTGDMVGPRSIESGLIAFGRIAKVDSGYVPIFSYQDAQDFMARKKALGGTIVKSYRQPMRSQRQMLIKAGREAGVMVDVEGEAISISTSPPSSTATPISSTTCRSRPTTTTWCSCSSMARRRTRRR